MKAIPLLIALCFLCSCVFVQTTNPLLQDEKSNPELLGLWHSDNKDLEAFQYLHILPVKDNKLEFVTVGSEDEKAVVGHWRGFASTVGANYFLNVKEVNEKDNTIDDYILVNYAVKADQLEIRFLQLDVIAELIESGKLKGEVTRESGEEKKITKLLITDSTENLTKFLEAGDMKKLTGDPIIFKKITHQ